MPVNPCGAVCDWGRRAYRTRCRFGVGGALETGIRWYAADPKAKPLPFASAILNSDWEDNDAERDYGFDPAHVGEVRGAERTTAWADMPKGHKGGHVCGDPEWFRSGVPADPARPAVRYNADGLPVCCAPGAGILWGDPPGGVGGLLWGEAPATTPINGTDTCPGPDLVFGVTYHQTPRPLGVPGTGLWFRAPGWVAPRTVQWADTGGANPVAGVAFFQAPTGDCAGILFLTTIAGATGSYSNPIFPGATLWAVVLPTDTTVGQPVPEFTISFT